MKFDKLKKRLSFLVVGGIMIFSIPALSSCSLFYIKVPIAASSLHNYMNPSSQIEWISKRTMSLKFVSTSGSIGYGTGWIFGKNAKKTNSYYIATNMHVASFLQNQNKTFYTPNNYNDGYTKTTQPAYSDIHIGLVGTKTLNNTFIQGTEDAMRTYKDGGIHYVSYIPVSAANIVYSGYQSFEKDRNKYTDPFNIRGQYINNPTTDLALIEMDFSKANKLNNYNPNILKSFLINYDLNPTKFAKSPGENYKNLYIGGFPYDNSILNPGDSLLGGSKYPIWVGLSYVDLEKVTSGLTLPVQRPNQVGVGYPYTNVAIRNEIAYSTDSFNSYRNVSLQGLLKGIDIGGGSSGSMVTNSNNEVVGIYWGTYTMSSSSGTTIYGGFDYFYSSQSYRVTANGKSVICYNYNILESIENIVGESNFVNDIW